MHLSRGHRLKVTQGKQVTKVRIGGASRIFFVRLVSQGLLEVSGEENSRFEPAKRRPAAGELTRQGSCVLIQGSCVLIR
jgi:hypothetical protein